MADVILPQLIPVPIETAASIRFNGRVSARDISYALTTAFLAAQSGESGVVRVSDNGLRAALGRTRRDRIEVEVGRIERLGLTRIVTDEIGAVGEDVPAPTQPVGRRLDGSPDPDRHHPNGGDLKWIIADELAEAFKVSEETKTVDLPARILQYARKRHTAIVLMRVLAIWAGWGDPRWTMQHAPANRTFRLPVKDAAEAFMLDDPRPSHWLRDVLAPAADEINKIAPWWHVEIELVSSSPRPARAGRPAARARTVALNVYVDFDERQVPVNKTQSEPTKGWRHPIPRGPRPNYYAPPQAPAQNVAPFRRPTAPSATLPRPGLPPVSPTYRPIADEDSEIPF